jgi:hypothetical protein
MNDSAGELMNLVGGNNKREYQEPKQNSSIIKSMIPKTRHAIAAPIPIVKRKPHITGKTGGTRLDQEVFFDDEDNFESF